LLALTLGFSASLSAFAVDSPAFSVKVIGTLDAEKTFNGQDTLIIDWQIMANKDGLTLRNTQGLRLAYDNAVLQLMKWDGSGVVADSSTGATFSPISQAGSSGVYPFGFRVFAAKNASGNLGYLNISLGSAYDTYLCPKGRYVSLGRTRFVFRAGKTFSDLTANSIRCMTVSELSATAQSSAILLNTSENDVTSYEYLRQANGVAIGGDKLNAPAITYPRGTSGDDGNGKPPNETPSHNEPVAPDDPANKKTPLSDIDYINPYTDVPSNAWYFSAVKYVTVNGFMNGTGNNRFSPSTPTTRAMFATVLHRMAGKPNASGPNVFTDVADGKWYTDAIRWANEKKLVLGYGNNKFGTNDNITREQAVTLLYRYSELIGLDISGQADLSKYSDASKISSWALVAMRWAVSAGIVSGRTPTTLVPQGQMTRVEAAQLLLNYS